MTIGGNGCNSCSWCSGAVLLLPSSRSAPQMRVKVVDYQPTITATPQRVGAIPTRLPVTCFPQDGKATSVRYRVTDQPKIATWHLGFYIPGDEYAAVEQEQRQRRQFIPRATDKGKAEGEAVRSTACRGPNAVSPKVATVRWFSHRIN